MRIESNRTGPARAKSARKSDGSSAVFSPATEEAETQAQSVSGASQLDGVGALLALQSVDDPQVLRKRALRHGAKLLDALDEMKADLLVGQISEGHAHRLAALVSRARNLSEPEIEAVLDDIELRAKVELAKLGY